MTRRRVTAVFALFALLAVSSCSSKYFRSIVNRNKSPEPPVLPEPVEAPVIGELEVTILHKADYNIDDSQTVKDFKVLANEIDYRTELARYSVELPKPVDFSQNIVLASTMGTQLSGGYVISVLLAEEYAEKVVVTVGLNSPGASCITTSALSNPYEFVLIPTVKPIEFVESKTVNDCV